MKAYNEEEFGQAINHFRNQASPWVQFNGLTGDDVEAYKAYATRLGLFAQVESESRPFTVSYRMRVMIGESVATG